MGGVHRGRRFEFPPDVSIRPSPDRVRETVFNWLAPLMDGARCLDLFAGSGALGLEAVSRGAARVEFVDRSAPAARAIREHLARLKEQSRAAVHVTDVLAFLRISPETPFDIVFADPPYRAGLLAPVIDALEAGRWLAHGAHIYLECGRHETLPSLPDGWALHREKTAGQVAYRLAVRD